MYTHAPNAHTAHTVHNTAIMNMHTTVANVKPVLWCASAYCSCCLGHSEQFVA